MALGLVVELGGLRRRQVGVVAEVADLLLELALERSIDRTIGRRRVRRVAEQGQEVRAARDRSDVVGAAAGEEAEHVAAAEQGDDAVGQLRLALVDRRVVRVDGEDCDDVAHAEGLLVADDRLLVRVGLQEL